ncbi:DedA family protein [Streptomyces sp. FR-108]|uniref:DedA family protein n=1 Tax=Streptomyces sp. FR-108 TaxID=3416665 RepID=UPI003CE9CDB4
MALLDVLDWLESLPEPALLAGTGLLVLGEATIGLGIIVPGEAALLLASGTVDSTSEFLVLWSILTLCAVLGNIVGFEMGRRLGPAARETRLVQKHGAETWDKASGMLRKHGTWAVFVGRVTPVVRIFLPPVAGAANMPYRTFLLPVTAGAACQTALSILIGIGVLTGVKSADSRVLVAAGLLLALAIALGVVRKRSRNKKAGAEKAAASRGADQDPDPTFERAG